MAKRKKTPPITSGISRHQRLKLISERLSTAADREMRDRLARVATALKASKDEEQEWAAACIQNFLQGKKKSLDEAFSLQPPKPRRRGPAPKPETEEMARRIFEMKKSGKTFEQISEVVKLSDRRCKTLHSEYGPQFRVVEAIKTSWRRGSRN